jgi:hypothetical protein
VDNIAFVGPTTNMVVDQFNPSGIGANSYSGGNLINVWYNWFGAGWVTNTWDTANDAIGLAANDKVYDGSTAATVSVYDSIVNAALSGVRAGDLPNVALSTNGYSAAFAAAGAGSNIAVTVSGLTLAGSAGGNYSISPVTLSAAISRLTVTPNVVANDKVYDGTISATLGGSLVGAVIGDDIALGTNGCSATFATVDVGTNIVVTAAGTLGLSGSASGSYSLSQSSVPPVLSADITPATVLVSADDKSWTFGLPNPGLTASWSGFVNGEGTNVLTTSATLATTADVNSAVGSYPITAGGAVAANYVFNYAPGTLTVVAQPQIAGLNAGAAGFGLTFPTLPGQMYQLLIKTNLTDVVWTPLGDPIPGTGGSVSITNHSGAAQSFYWLQIWQP